ncbi:MAG: tyrosine recombinase XerC [Woeseiaceae bacterium]
MVAGMAGSYNGPMLLNETEWIERFVRHLKFERRLSPLTCKHYQRDLEALASYCEREHVQRWADVDSEHVRSFSAACYRKGLGARSIARRLSAIRSFFRFLQREKLLKSNPAADLRSPKASKRLPANLDADRMARLLDIKGEGPVVSRDRAMLELLYSSGLRLAELTGLDRASVDMTDCTVRVTGKGSKQRIVPVGRYAMQALRDWQAARPALAGASETALFVSIRGTRLSPRSVQARVDHWARKQGIDMKVYPHLFRHSFATHLLESSHDLRGVQELLGHANIGTTQVYTHLDFQHLAQIYDRTHPRARSRAKSKR